MSQPTNTLKTFGWALPLAAAVIALGAGNASASTRYVDNTPRFETACKSDRGSFSTIQAAVNASAPYDTVVVCPGTYVEQVTITTDGLKLQSHKPRAATIQAPEPLTDSKAVVDIDGAVSARVTGFTISGADSWDLQRGVWVHDDARRARIVSNRILEIRSGGPCCEGTGIEFGGWPAAGGGVAKGNEILDYQSIGIAVNGGSVVSLTHNHITGPIPDYRAQTGISIDFDGENGAPSRVSVRNNTVSDNRGPHGTTASGIALFDVAGDATVTSNHLTNNDTGIGVEVTKDVVVQGNVARLGKYGIVNDWLSTGNTYADNEALDNTEVDCRDDTYHLHENFATANTWIDNIGAIADPGSICN